MHAHDRLIRYVLNRRENAIALARVVLPPAVAALVDFDGLRVESGHQLDAELRERIVDLLFHLPFTQPLAQHLAQPRPDSSDREEPTGCYLDLILEHQSRSDRWMPMRTACATTQRWSQWQRDHPGAARLPMVLTVVLSHDPAGWRAATDVNAMLHLSPDQRAAFAGYVPSLPFHLFDLTRVDEAQLRLGAESAAVELMLLCFKHARDGRSLVAMLRERLALIRDVTQAPDGVEAVMALLRYLAQVTRGEEFATVIYASFVEAAAPEIVERIEMENFEDFVEKYGRNWRAAFAARVQAEALQKGIEQGREQGISRGIEEGITRGKRETLIHQLKLRFRLDGLPDWLARRVEAADLNALVAAESRILFAERPEDVLPEAEPRSH